MPIADPRVAQLTWGQRLGVSRCPPGQPLAAEQVTASHDIALNSSQCWDQTLPRQLEFSKLQQSLLGKKWSSRLSSRGCSHRSCHRGFPSWHLAKRPQQHPNHAGGLGSEISLFLSKFLPVSFPHTWLGGIQFEPKPPNLPKTGGISANQKAWFAASCFSSCHSTDKVKSWGWR